MAKKRNEVNGVLVYRRWCVGAILSTILLLVAIAPPILLVVFKWMAVTVPEGSSVYTAGTYSQIGIDLLVSIIKKTPTPFQGLVNAIVPGSPIQYFNHIYTYGMYAFLGLLGIIAIFVVVQAFFFLFYLFTGRVVSPSAPVKISWVLFVLMAIFTGATVGFLFALNMAYGGASGGSSLKLDFWWPVYFTGGSFLAALLLSIIYVISFKDKFYIGRAKRFGSGGSSESRYETTHIITSNGVQPAPAAAGAQPQVIVVNTTPAAGAPSSIVTIPANGQPTVTNEVVKPAVQESGEVNIAPAGTLPPDIKSIGGHAYSKNLDLKYADIPHGIKELGVGAFANCLNLEMVSIPTSIKRIKKNCFFNCTKLARINYAGTKSEWRYIVRGSNWLDRAGTRTVVCSDGAIIVDPHR